MIMKQMARQLAPRVFREMLAAMRALPVYPPMMEWAKRQQVAVCIRVADQPECVMIHCAEHEDVDWADLDGQARGEAQILQSHLDDEDRAGSFAASSFLGSAGGAIAFPLDGVETIVSARGLPGSGNDAFVLMLIRAVAVRNINDGDWDGETGPRMDDMTRAVRDRSNQVSNQLGIPYYDDLKKQFNLTAACSPHAE